MSRDSTDDVGEAGEAAEEHAAMQAAADRLSVKLQAFYEALPADEREVMALLLHRFASQRTPAGSGRAQLLFSLDTGEGAALSPRRPGARRGRRCK